MNKPKRINSQKFNFSFFLSGRTKIYDLENAAKQHGGATKNLITEESYSNIEGSEYITINHNNNKIGLFVPDTINTNKKIDNSDILKTIANKIYSQYAIDQISFIPAIGTWYSEDLNQVVYDNITIIESILNDITESDIEFFISLAEQIKKDMSQEGVSISINDSLAIV